MWLIDIAWDLQKLGITLENKVHIKSFLIQVREICEVINAGTQPIQNLSVMVKHSSDQSERVKWSHFWIEKGLQSVEILIEKCSGNFCVGDTLTMADCCLVPQVYNANRFKVDMNQFPNIDKLACLQCVCNAWFTLELLVRFISCPGIKPFITTF